jgi:phosphatidylserine/phosphatidylglycerophosphate/cardiolipin synthase-like enzyme
MPKSSMFRIRSRLSVGGLWVAAALAMAFTPALADEATRIFYSPEKDLEQIDVAEIDGATRTVDMFAYVLTDRAVVGALRAAGARGVRVRIWRDAEMAEKLADFDVAAQLAGGAAGVEVRIKPAGELMHLKGYCIDGAELRTGSANFSRSGETRQDNDLVLIRSATACAGFEAKFEKAWGSGGQRTAN